MITITEQGGEELKAAVESLGASAPKVIAGSLYRSAERIMADSKEHYVPVDSGNLRAGGFVESPEIGSHGITVTLGYAGPYALAVHENPRAGKTGGLSPSGRHYKHWAAVGEWKYLETPWKLAAPQIAEDLTQDVEAAVTEMGHS